MRRMVWSSLLLLALFHPGVFADSKECVDCTSAPLNDTTTPAVAAATQSAADIAKALEASYCQQLYECSYGYCGSTPSNQCGLSATEAGALRSYMGSGYHRINAQLWGQQNTPSCIPVIQKMNEALQRLPRFQGVVYRGTHLPDGVRAQHVEGTVVTYPAFTSSSTDIRVAAGFGSASSSGSDFFTIISTSARPIMTLGSRESEMLFASGTQFQILKRFPAINNQYRYIMVEVIPGETKKARKRRYAAALEQGMEFETAQQAVIKKNFDWEFSLWDKKISAYQWRCPTDGTAVPTEIVASPSSSASPPPPSAQADPTGTPP